MRQRGITVQAVALLVLAGITCVGLRYQARRDVRLGLVDRVWRLTYASEADAEGRGAELRVAVPSDIPHGRVLRQDYQHTNLRVGPLQSATSEAGEVVAVAEDEDECWLTFRFDLLLSRQAKWTAGVPRDALGEDARAKYLDDEDEIQVDSPAVSDTLEQLQTQRMDSTALVERIAELCHRQIAEGGSDAPDDAEEVLEQGTATAASRARAMVALCRASGIPARPVAGFEIVEANETTPRVWVEVLLEKRWASYDPAGGFRGELPYNFWPVRRGDVQLVLSEGMDGIETEYSIVPLPGTPYGAETQGRRLVDVLDLTRLPLEMHDVLSLILLMPLGALVTCVFRNIIGLPTSGTFTPTLLALAFVYADWRTGLLVLGAAIVLGFATRNLLEWLKLLMLPRLSIVLTLVVCCLVFGVSLLDYFRLTPGVQAVLLPMVILTMIVERFYVTTQEDGMTVAVQRLAGTTVVGLCCYLVFRWRAVAGLLLVYPELHLFTVAVLILLGRYTGYQLLEPWRFRDVVDIEPGSRPR